MRQFCPLGCSSCLIHHWMFYSIQPGRLYGRCPDCGGACPAVGAHITFSEPPICEASRQRMTGASEEDQFGGCLQSNDKTYCVQLLRCTVSIMRSSSLCSVSNGAKYCNPRGFKFRGVEMDETLSVHIHTGGRKKNRTPRFSDVFEIIGRFRHRLRLGLHRTNLQEFLQDNDKLSPDHSAAQNIFYVAEHTVKSFTVLRTHLHEFYDFFDKSLSHYTGRHTIKKGLYIINTPG